MLKQADLLNRNIISSPITTGIQRCLEIGNYIFNLWGSTISGLSARDFFHLTENI